MPALTLQQAESKKLGLIIAKKSLRTFFILYDTQYLVKLFHDVFDKVKKENSKLKVSDQLHIVGTLIQHKYLRKMKKNIVVSMLTVNSDSGDSEARVVANSAAEFSAGPLIYDIAMSHVGWLTSDRSSVSKYAYRIWDYYYHNRNDVEKQKLEKHLEYLDEEGNTDEILNYKFMLKKPIDVSQLKKNHRDMILWIGRNIPKLNMISLAYEFFDELYETD